MNQQPSSTDRYAIVWAVKPCSVCDLPAQLQRGLIAMICALLLLSAGCASKQVKYSGFMQNYPQFKPGRDKSAKVYVKEGVDFKRYKKIMMDEVVFFFNDANKYKGISPEEMKDLADAWHKDMFDAFKGYTFTDRPGPDVVRIRTAITDIDVSHPARNVVSTVVPVGLAVSIVKKAAAGSYPGVGGASMEMEILDSVSGERLAAAIDSKSGGKISGLSKYGAAKEAFQYWAKRLRERFDEMGGGPAKTN